MEGGGVFSETEEGRFPWYELNYPRRGGKWRAYMSAQHCVAVADKSLSPGSVRRVVGGGGGGGAGGKAARVVSRFPGCDEVARKCCISRLASRAKAGPRDVMPDSFCVPSEAAALAACVSDTSRGGERLWILKPTNGSSGQGIRVVRQGEVMDSVRDVMMGLRGDGDGEEEQEDTHVVQRYIENPALIQGRKFDLRAYGLLVRRPDGAWQSYICQEGYVRISRQSYSVDALDDKGAHITNHVVLRDEYFKRESPLLDKRLLSSVLSMWEVDVWGQLKASTGWVQSLMREELESRMDLNLGDVTFYQLLGLDFLVDENGTVHLLEVNSNPNMTGDSPVAVTAKAQAVAGALDIAVGPGTGCKAVLACLSGTEEGSRTNLFDPEGGFFGTPEKMGDAGRCYQPVFGAATES